MCPVVALSGRWRKRPLWFGERPAGSRIRKFTSFLHFSAAPYPCGWHDEIADNQPQSAKSATLITLALMVRIRTAERMKLGSLSRRKFIAVLTVAAAWPLVGRAQQPERMRRIGVLISWSESDPFSQESRTAFERALERFGWVAGKNIRIAYRFAAGDPALFKTYAAELVGLTPDAVLTSTTPGVSALREQTRTIPIVFVAVADPVGQGFVQSLARPGGNITGFSSFDPTLMGKWLQLLKEIVPDLTRVAAIFNPDTTPYAFFNRGIEPAAMSLGVTVTPAPVHDDDAIENAIAAEARKPEGGLISLPDSFTETHRDAIIAATTRYRLPLIGTSTFPRSGGLISYWSDPVDRYAQAASYIDRILRGASPADLPVQRPTKYSMIINLKTAKAIGLTMPPMLLGQADAVIE
jgi:putative tryptophan/tyrosine transport system substrate-binding protein